MSRVYDHKKLYSGASFPSIGEGFFLFTGADGEVIGVNLPSLNWAKFTQETPSDRWHFEHNFGYPPLVQVYSQGRVITESVTVNVGNTTVDIQTDNGVAISGYLTLMGASGSRGTQTTPDPSNDAISGLLQALETHERMRGRGYHLPDGGISNEQVAENAAISLTKIDGLIDSLQNLRNQINTKQPVGDYAVETGFLTHVQAQGINNHIPITGITNREVADNAAIAWNKISKITASPADIGAQPIGNYATLVDGTIPTSQLPTGSIINIYSVDSQSAMLATTEIEVGDMVLRTDFTPPETFMLMSLPSSSLNNWQRTDITVTSVNGQIGSVVLNASDVGALPVNDPSVTNARIPAGNAGGDLSGIYPNPTLSSADLRAISSISANQGILQKTGTGAWQLLSSIPNSLISGLKALAFKDSIADGDIATNAAIAWSKISKTAANPVDIGAQPAGNYATLIDGVIQTTQLPANLTSNTTSNAGGDLSGTYPNPTLSSVDLRAIASISATQGILQKTGTGTWQVLTSISSSLVSGLKALAFKDVIADSDIAANAAIAWNKISKTAANPVDIGAQPAGNYATLVNGVIPTSQLPTNSIVNIYSSNSQSAMLAMTGIEVGDMVLRTDFTPPEIFLLTALPASLLSNWRRIDSTVTSVNGQIGLVVLNASDVGALPVNDPSVTNARIPTGNAGGDLSGTYPNPTLNSVDLRAIASISATQGILQKTGTGTWQVLTSISSSLVSGLKALAFKDVIADSDIAANAAIAWSKISKTGATISDVGLNATTAGLAFIGADLATQKNLINYGFHYYQASVPSSPQTGERWAELDSGGFLLDEWVYNGSRWVGTHSLTAASVQSNISTYPTSIFFGYLTVKYDILIERISLNYNQSANSYLAGTNYCTAKFQLTAIQLDQTSGGNSGNGYIGTVNQASNTGCTYLDINKVFATSSSNYAIGVTVTKTGTNTNIFYSNFGIQYRWIRK